YHPYAPALVEKLQTSVRALLDADTAQPPLEEDQCAATYAPTAAVDRPYPVKELDFSSSGAYSVYNWELFFHAPLTIAIHLSRNQRFEEAQKWFHYVFDPTDDSDGPTPDRFWKVKPLQESDVVSIEAILVNLSTGADDALKQQTIDCIRAWRAQPFRPHLIARYRPSAYMFKTVMAYLDNLIAWGDSLFAEDTGESINEATQLYVLAANLLGPRPQAVPTKNRTPPRSYAALAAQLDAFGDTLVALETDVGMDLAPPPGPPVGDDAHHAGSATLGSLGRALYFCVPQNDKLLAYWDTVADRLFKIRNSLNLEGVFRQLPLFEPPIDPGLLAAAAAVGLDVGAVVSGANQPLPLVRFVFLIQKANELCQEVTMLGAQLLASMEKEDAEALGILRAQHERQLLALAESVKYSQLQEAKKAREGLERSLDNAWQRYSWYERQLGVAAGSLTPPRIDALDGDGLAQMSFQQGEPTVPQRPLQIDVVQDVSGIATGMMLSNREELELTKLVAAHDQHETASAIDQIGIFLSIIPSFSINTMPFGLGGSISFGGSNLAAVASAMSSYHKQDAERLTYDATNAAKSGGYSRRQQDWAWQSNLAAGEMMQVYKQLRAAQIREAIAEREWRNHQQQIRNAEAIEQFLTDEHNGKETNQAFYAWMKREVKALYAQCFQFAFDVARKAERALQHELGSDAAFLQFGYLAGKEGLLAGEKLQFDLRRMDVAFHDLNQRELELTRHISLQQLDALALMQLRATGSCNISLPEDLFDLDCPGHYFRRIRTVAISLPCVAGPYASVNCTLTLLRSSIRKRSAVDAGYARSGAADPRFDDHFGSLQAIVTSGGQSDGGMFETNLRDERYLPFEGSGAISEWRLDLPSDVRQFDYDTMTDVILHLRYTARDGGALLRDGAT